MEGSLLFQGTLLLALMALMLLVYRRIPAKCHQVKEGVRQRQ